AGWIGYWWVAQGHGDLANLSIATVLVAIHWFIVGSLLTAERAGLSQRVARAIPRVEWRRMFLAFLLPGPGTGLAFLLVNLLCLVGLVGLGELTVGIVWPGTASKGHHPTLLALSLASYIVIYCGLGKILIQAIR